MLNVFAGDHGQLNSLNRVSERAAPLFGLESAQPDSRPLVVTKRLSTICDELGITKIDVLHVDAQGSDLEVLRSLDEARLRSVKSGAIEVSHWACASTRQANPEPKPDWFWRAWDSVSSA